jgi:hypothetical protein
MPIYLSPFTAAQFGRRCAAIAVATLLTAGSVPIRAEIVEDFGLEGMDGDEGVQPPAPGSIHGGGGTPGQSALAVAPQFFPGDLFQAAHALGGKGGSGGSGANAQTALGEQPGNGGVGNGGGVAVARAHVAPAVPGGSASALASAIGGRGGAGGTAGESDNGAGFAGDGGDGGAATAMASGVHAGLLAFEQLSLRASAIGGAGGPGGWRSLPSGPSLGGDAGTGAGATAEASGHGFGTLRVVVSAEAVGGRGGSSTALQAGAGGGATAVARGRHDGGGSLTLSASARGGDGGLGIVTGIPPAITQTSGGSGGGVWLVDAIRGLADPNHPTHSGERFTTGELTFNQTAQGGSGGGGFAGRDGGGAVSTLTLATEGTINPGIAPHAQFQITARGGNGGHGIFESGGAGGTAVASTHLTAYNATAEDRVIGIGVFAEGGRGGGSNLDQSGPGGSARFGTVGVVDGDGAYGIQAHAPNGGDLFLFGLANGGAGGTGSGTFENPGAGTGGRGGDAVLINSFDATTARGAIRIFGTASAGAGGNASGSTPGDGGDAIIVQNRTPESPSLTSYVRAAESLELVFQAMGGSGGRKGFQNEFARGGDGVVQADVVNPIGAIRLDASARAGATQAPALAGVARANAFAAGRNDVESRAAAVASFFDPILPIPGGADAHARAELLGDSGEARARATAFGASGQALAEVVVGGALIRQLALAGSAEVGSTAESASRAKLATSAFGFESFAAQAGVDAIVLPTDPAVANALFPNPLAKAAVNGLEGLVTHVGLFRFITTAAQDSEREHTYDARFSLSLDPSIAGGTLLLSLLRVGDFTPVLAGGFQSLSFTAKVGLNTVVDFSTNDPAVAASFFADNPLSLGVLNGAETLTVALTAVLTQPAHSWEARALVSTSLAVIPEPATAGLLLGVAVLVLVSASRRRF